MFGRLRKRCTAALGGLALATAACAASAAGPTFQLAYEPKGLDWSAAEVERSTRPQFDAIVRRAEQERLLGCEHHCERYKRIFERLVAVARVQTERARHLPWSLTIVRSPDVEAVALPGGEVLISESFVQARGLDDEALAFVLGHEMAHSILEHERQTLHMAHMLLPRNVPRNVADMYAELGFNHALLKSLEPVMQQGEYEADELGLLLAGAAGYEPRRQLAFIEQEVRRGDAPSFIHTHPPAALRLERLRSQLPLAERVYAAARGAGTAAPARAGPR